MLKAILKFVRRQLVKNNWVKCQVEAYRLRQKKQRHHERWAQLMHAGQTVKAIRDNKGFD